ncbi:hypothetical protein YC2023_058704 [Brassica napus]
MGGNPSYPRCTKLVLKGTVCAIATPVNKADMIFTKISDLPVNLVEEILSKVPLKSMRAVRLTCKRWEALWKSRSFSKMHIDKIRSGESLMIAKMDYHLYLVRIVVNEDPIIECQGRLTCKDKQTKISQVFHCDGLLLCFLKDDVTKYIVWNPYLGQTRSIESPYSHRRPDRCPAAGWNWFTYGWKNWFTYALGYEDKGSTCRGYKLLRFIDKIFDTPRDQFSCYKIYDLDSSTWKTLDITPNSPRILPSHRGGVSLKGNTYWLASQRNAGQYVLDDHIICFDFTSESFGPLLPLPFYAGANDDVTLSCVREDKLALSLSRINEASQLECISSNLLLEAKGNNTRI